MRDELCLDNKRILERVDLDFFDKNIDNFNMAFLLKWNLGSKHLKNIEVIRFDMFRKVRIIFNGLPFKLLLIFRCWNKFCNEFDKIFVNFKERILGKLS